jgi:5-hydroxyisourate hydrolase
MARLSTHVLDTSQGRPAAGVRIRMYRAGELLLDAETNADGRLLLDENAPAGAYELVFDVGAYFALPGTPFLNEVVVRFGIADAAANYHMPLLVSPYGYTTYRGS